MAVKECPYKCPVCGQGDLAGGGPLACRYTCGHVVSRAGGNQDITKKKKKFAWSKSK